MNRIKHFLILALALAMSLGAWAQGVEYYLAGSMTLWNFSDPAYKLTYTDYVNAYTLTTTLSANDEFLVVGTDNGWYPDNNNYVVSASGTYTIYFDPAGNHDGWHGGYFNVVEGSLPPAAPDPYAPALDETTGHWNFLMPGANKVVKAVLYDSIVLGPHVELYDASPAFAAGDIYTRGDSTIYYYDTNNHHTFYLRADEQADSKYFGFWSDLDPTDSYYNDRTYRRVSTGSLTCGHRFTAAYLNNYTLTLNPSAGGTLSLDGVVISPETQLTTITPDGSGNITYSAANMATLDKGSAAYNSTDGWRSGSQTTQLTVTAAEGVNITSVKFNTSENGGSWTDTDAPFQVTLMGGYVLDPDYNLLETGVTSIEVYGTTITTPTGVTAGTTANTYSVMEGLTVNVTATPDSAHYLASIDGHDTVGNYATGYSFVMPSDDYTLNATFNAKPTLTLAQTDGGTLEAIIPSGAPATALLNVPSSWDEQSPLLTPSDLPGFQPMTEAEARAWTGVPATGNGMLFYAYNADNSEWTALQYGNGSFDNNPSTYTWSRGDLHYSHNSYGAEYYYTTGASTANVIASSTPNTYIIDYGTPVTVVATPDAQHYLVSFSDDDPATERNDNFAVEKTYDSVIADIPTLTATFQAKPTLTLTANDGGTLTLDGYTPAVEASESIATTSSTNTDDPIAFNGDHFTISSPWGADGDGIKIPTEGTGDFATISSLNGEIITKVEFTRGFGSIDRLRSAVGTVTYSGNVATVSGVNATSLNVTRSNILQINQVKVYYASTPETYPDGVVSANATADTFVVDYGTTLTVTATPDATHYLATLGEELVNSNDSIHRTFTMTAPVNLPADFRAKPTLTLAHNQGGEMEIVPAGGVTAIVPPTDKIALWESNYGGTLSEVDMPATLGFVAVDGEAAEAWTGAPASGDAMLIYDIDGETFYYLSFNDGSLLGNAETFFSPGSFYDMASAGTLYITTGVTPSNVTAIANTNTYYIDYNTSVTVKATPSDTAYLVRFDQDDDTNSNTAVEKTYGPLTAALTTAEATFNAKPVLTLAQNESWGTVSVSGPVVWNNQVWGGWDFISTSFPQTVGDITINRSGIYCYSQNGKLFMSNSAGNNPHVTFTSAGDNFTRIEMTYTQGSNLQPASEWTCENGVAVWEGNAPSVSITNATNFYFTQIKFIRGSGIAQLTDNTYRIDYGATVKVNAQATTLHHVANWVNEDSVAYPADSITYSDYFITTPEPLFPAHSTLRLTVTADATAKALFGINSYDVVATAQLDDRAEIGTDTSMGRLFAAYFDIEGTSQHITNNDTIEYTAQGGSLSMVVAQPNYGYLFTGWYDAIADTLMTDSIFVRLTEAYEVEARFVPDTFSLATATNNKKWGNIDAEVSTADSSYPYLTWITLEAKPIVGNHFDHWSDENLAPGQESMGPQRTFQLTQDTSITAVFARTYYDVRYQPNVEGRGTIACEHPNPFQCNYIYTTHMKATAAEGYHFDHWTTLYTDTVMGTSDSIDIVVMRDTNIVAVFLPNQYGLTALSANETQGLTTGTGSYDYGDTATITATGNYGYHFTNWSDGDLNAERAIVINFTHDSTLTAYFAKNQYTITVRSANDTMGSVAGTQTVDYMTEVEISATANEHYHFTQWNDEVTNATRTVTVTSDTGFTAYFGPDSYTVVALADQGQGTVTGSGSYLYRATATVEASPACGYVFDHWSNGETASSLVFAVTGDENLTAFFRAAVVDTVTVHDTTYVDNYIHDTTYVDIHDSVDVTVYVHDTTIVTDTVTEYVHDTTTVTDTVTVTEYVTDTLYMTEYVHDTTTVFDTIEVEVPVHDTAYIALDTMYINVPDTNYGIVELFDTTYTDVTIYDTTTVDVTVYDTTNVDVTIYDTTNVDVTIYDTTNVDVTIYDTTNVDVTIYDTTSVPVTVYDTTSVPVTVYDTTNVDVTVYDTTSVPVTVYDTTSVDVTVYDTTSVPVTVYDTTSVDVTVYDTTSVPVTVYDTTNVPVTVYDTTSVPVTVYDTTSVPVTEYDTTTVPVTVFDTTFVPVTMYDTTTVPVTVFDTTTVPVTVMDTTVVPVDVFDTTHVDVTVVDSTLVPIHDTITVTEIQYHVDTLYIYDTVQIHDTVYVSEGIDGAETISAKVYANNGDIVVEGAEGNMVVLYDVTGRVLARKRDDDGQPLRFEAPASGSYLIRIGNYPARRVVVVR